MESTKGTLQVGSRVACIFKESFSKKEVLGTVLKTGFPEWTEIRLDDGSFTSGKFVYYRGIEGDNNE